MMIVVMIVVMMMIHLNYFDSHEQWEGKSGHDEKDGDHGHEVGADAGALVAHWGKYF